MKHIESYTDYVNENVINLSKKRKFPTYGDTEKDRKYKSIADQTDIRSIYDLNKHDIGKYLNTWFVGEVKHSSNDKFVILDEMITVKKVDEDTQNHLYDRVYNPVALRIVCPTGAKFKQDENGYDLYNMYAMIESIDDSSYKVWFDQKTFDELVSIRTQIMKWINTQSILNGEEFLDYCISVGADPESKDYN